MKKILTLITLLSTLFLASCKVNWFGEQIDAEWWVIFIPVAILTVVILAIGKITLSKKTYICPECQKEIRPKWWQAFFAIHVDSDRVLKCPNCGRRGFCKVYKDE